MPDALAAITTRHTPQAQPADPRQVPNSAGGYTFKTAPAARIHRFLTLGVDGGTYYASERQIAVQNATIVMQAARDNATALTAAIVAVSQAGRAPRNNPALFALAAAASLGDEAGRKAALDALPLVARTGTHLFTFAQYIGQFRGWGRGLVRAVGGWYLDKDPADLAYQVLKYRQRDGWSHRDVLRKAHPLRSDLGQQATAAHRALFDWVCGREADLAELPLVRAFMGAQAATMTATWVSLIEQNRSLSWEMLPDEALAKPAVWRALIEGGNLPQGALIRQLPRLTRLGVLRAGDMFTLDVAGKIAAPQRLAKARVHPVNVLVALRTYASGHGARGQDTWQPVPAITDALDAAFYASFGAVEPAGKRTMLALDVSGSMTQAISGLPLSCREASAALALVTAATEPLALVTGFTSASRGGYGGRWGGGDPGITTLDISPRQRLDDAIGKVSGLPFGCTDCSLPMQWALANKVEIDHFSIYTDNETYAGRMHPHQALEQYRQKTGIAARLSVVGMTATDFTIADPDDPGSLDIAGFDSAAPSLLAAFARGDI